MDNPTANIQKPDFVPLERSEATSPGRAYFDKADLMLVQMVNSVLELPPGDWFKPISNLFDPALHPNGIKRLAVSREERIAYAIVNLLESLEEGSSEKRLAALRTLHDEVVYSAITEFRTNTGRVLIQIMKEIVRAEGNLLLQQKLAHDFRLASYGNPRIVRKLLARYNLLEMPENGSQITFDNHVHDSNTKGRKSPTHLIMDAWIKGIQALTVVYYNHVETGPARELLEAAEIMGIHVRIGIEFNCVFYNKRARFIWAPHGFASSSEFIDFLEKPQIAGLMKEGYEVSLFRQNIIFKLLDNFNNLHLSNLNLEFGIDMPPLEYGEFGRFVGKGQASRLHLAEFIYRKMSPFIEERINALDLELATLEGTKGDKKKGKDQSILSEADLMRIESIHNYLQHVENLTPEDIQYSYLGPANNSDVPDPDNPPVSDDLPSLAREEIASMVRRVSELHNNSDIVLTLTNLSLEDVVEILYDCEGLISHIELFNYKDYVVGRSPQIRRINLFQTAVNNGNVIVVKRILRRLLRMFRSEDSPNTVRIVKFERILRNIPKLQSFYATRPLGSRLGSDSTGRSKRFFGMGLAFIKTLPPRARKAIAKRQGLHLILPVYSTVYPRVDYLPKTEFGIFGKATAQKLSTIPSLSRFAYTKKKRWVVRSNSSQFSSKGNVITLGSTGGKENLIVKKMSVRKNIQNEKMGFDYLNTHLKNIIKVLVGLTVATATFMYTQNWWLLAFFGGAIWLGITSLRNIVQSVLGGGGFKRPNTLHWRDYVNWNRVADSLFYTGFSVPLLELLVRVVIMQNFLHANADSNPVLVYTTMSLVNGLYITSHNIYRGLPKEAAIANLFRSALAIPTAIVASAIIAKLIALATGPAKAELAVVQAAAIISKLSSDTVAAIIEGLADRTNNRRHRMFDYHHKIRQLYNTFIKLELMFPEHDVLELIKDPKEAIKSAGAEVSGMQLTLMINALDLMYFWYYQPRAVEVLKEIVRKMTLEERIILLRSQNVLMREKEISLMLVGGMLGRKFSKALAFYLNNWRQYLAAMEKLVGKV